MADEGTRKSARATKGQHTKTQEQLDQTPEPTKKRGGKKANAKKSEEDAEVEIIRCICGAAEQDDDSEEDWIACENCQAWQHNVCMGVTTDKKKLDVMTYFCEQCHPEDHKELLDSIVRGEKLWETRREEEEARQAASKPQRGKKAKGKRASDVKEASNGKAKSPTPTTGKKDTVGRNGSLKRKAENGQSENVKAKVQRVASYTKHEAGDYQRPPDVPDTIPELQDPVRVGVATLIHKSLQRALKIAQKSGDFPPDNAELEKVALNLALEIERATYDTSASTSFYKEQSRRLSSNLKTNQELCEGLIKQTLTPLSFATMTVEEMASRELQRQDAEMKAKSDKQSIIVDDDLGPRVRRTHKGDEIVEHDESAPADEMPKIRRRSMLDPNAGMGARSRENSPGDGGELPIDIDDYRSRDDIRGNALSPPPEFSTKIRASPPPPTKPSVSTTTFDLNNVLSKVQSPTSSQRPRKPSVQVPRRGPGEDADIDRLLDDGQESPPYSPTDFDADPTVVWRGSLHMNSVADFPAIARHVGGAELTAVGEENMPWNEIVPTRLNVAGRIETEKANEYLCGLRYSTPTDIVVLALTTTNDTAKEQFKQLFDYFYSKGRYAVVGNKTFANVRDTYLVPVPAGSGNVPEFLLNLQTNKLPEDRPDPLLLVVLVIRHELADPTRSSGNNSPAVPQRQMSISSHGPTHSPLASQGSFPASGAFTPGPAAPPADLQRQQHDEQQRRGEQVAADILGPLISAPTVSFLMPQAYQMQPKEWIIIKEIFEEAPQSREDLGFLSSLLEKRNPENNSVGNAAATVGQ